VTGRLVTRARQLSVQWHLFQGREQLTVAEEALESLLLDDGTWLQTSREPRGRRASVPARFVSERRRWLRFVRAHRLWDVQLRYTRRWVRLPGPPPRHFSSEPEWTVYLSIPVRRFGAWIFTHRVRAAFPPFRRLTEHIAALLEAPDVDPMASQEEPIAIDGDLLANFCRGALPRLLEEQRGWRDMSPHHPLPILENGRHVLFPETLLPRRLRYVPDTRVAIPDGCWRALALDGNRLLVWRPEGGHRVYGSVTLAQPFYRYFPHLMFGHRRDALVVGDMEVQIPRALLTLKPREG